MTVQTEPIVWHRNPILQCEHWEHERVVELMEYTTLKAKTVVTFKTTDETTYSD
jgi:hypothetical protein